MPPPLTDEEVRQCLMARWQGEHVWVGIAHDAEGLPSRMASLETWLEATPAVYRREWEKASRYGLAADAKSRILAKLEAPSDPNMPLGKIVAQKLFRTVGELCDTHEVYAWGWTRTSSIRELPWWVLLPFAASVACILLATLLSEPAWAIGWVGGIAFGMMGVNYHRNQELRRRFTTTLDPQLTFQQLAVHVQFTARVRAEKMQAAAERIHQMTE